MINREDSQEITRAILSVVIIVIVAAVLWGLFKKEIPLSNRDAVMLVLGALLLRLSDVYAFHFNSSSSSQKKDQTIKTLADTAQVATVAAVPHEPGKIVLPPGGEVEVKAQDKPTPPQGDRS